MKRVVQNAEHGEIVYEESFLTGRKKVFVNGVELEKTDRKTYNYKKGEDIVPVRVDGNFLNGVTIGIGSSAPVLVVEKITWYEIVLAMLILVFNVTFGNIPAAVAVLPIVGGAIGGGVCAVIAMGYICVAKKFKKWWIKIVLFVGFFGLSILICYLIALAILAAL